MITLAGIESPGLTSSLSLAEMVSKMITEQVWGHGEAVSEAKSRRSAPQSQRREEKKVDNSTTIPKGARNEEIGGAALDAWA